MEEKIMARRSLADMSLEELGEIKVEPYKKDDSWFSKVKSWYKRNKKSKKGQSFSKDYLKQNPRSVLSHDTATRRDLKRSGMSDEDIDKLGIGGR
jgi:hypothetical protein